MDKNHFIDEYLKGKHPIEGESWELPFAQELEKDEALYDALLAERKSSKRSKRPIALRWLAAGIAASVLLLLALRFSQEPEGEPPVVAETVEQSAPQPAVSEPIIEEKQEEALPEVQPTPQPAKKRRKTVKKQGTPIEKPLLAEAEPMIEALAQNNSEERLSDPSNPYLLATTQLQDLRSRGERLDREVAMLMQH